MIGVALIVGGASLVACDAEPRVLASPPGASGAPQAHATARAVATVVERFARLPTVSTKTGAPLATVGPPRGAPPTPTLPPDATPTVFGPFRLIPAGWEGEVVSDVLDVPAAGTPSTGLAEVRASPMYREVPPPLLYGDLALVRGEAGTGGVALELRSPSNEHLSLRVVRLQPAYRPQNKVVTGGTRTTVTDGRYALLWESYPRARPWPARRIAIASVPPIRDDGYR